MILTTTDKVKYIIKKLELKKEEELLNVPCTQDKSGTVSYSNQWLIINWKINHDISRLEKLEFDLHYNKAIIDKKEVEKLEKHLQQIGVLEE